MRGPAPYATGHRCKPCLACDGFGWRRARAGEEPVDEYLGTRPESGERRKWEDEQDAQRRLERTERLLRLWEAPETIGYAWEERREAQFASGSFAELERALARLRERYPQRFSLWWRIIVCEEPVTVSPAARALLDSTSELLAAWMPEKIRVPRRLLPEKVNGYRKDSLWRGRTFRHAEQRSQRDREIVQMSAGGMGSVEIARHHGIDKRRVNQILAATASAL